MCPSRQSLNRPYHVPQLRVHGTIREITRNTSSSKMHGDGATFFAHQNRLMRGVAPCFPLRIRSRGCVRGILGRLV